jgi:hypothetical protein
MAKLLERSVSGLVVNPADLWSQIPAYATAQWDCCSWGGDGYLCGVRVSLSSWNTMTECLRNGIDVSVDVNGRSTYSDIEVSALSNEEAKKQVKPN